MSGMLGDGRRSASHRSCQACGKTLTYRGLFLFILRRFFTYILLLLFFLLLSLGKNLIEAVWWELGRTTTNVGIEELGSVVSNIVVSKHWETTGQVIAEDLAHHCQNVTSYSQFILGNRVGDSVLTVPCSSSHDSPLPSTSSPHSPLNICSPAAWHNPSLFVFCRKRNRIK